MSLQKEWFKIQQSYNTVRFKQIEKNTELLVNYLSDSNTKTSKFKDTKIVLARPLVEGEIIKISDKTQKQAKRGQWLVRDELHKQQILEEIEFESIYNVKDPFKGTGNVKAYKPNNETFIGVIYEGTPIDIQTLNNGIKTICSGCCIGVIKEGQQKKLIAYDANEFSERFVKVN